MKFKILFLLAILFLSGCATQTIAKNNCDNCLTYGGKCKDPYNSYIIIDGLNVREGCRGEE